MRSFFNKGNLKWIVTWFLIAILSVAVIFAFVKITDNEKTKKIGANSFTYAIGLLDVEDGEYVQGTGSIYMKNFQSVDGLKVEVDEDATIKYQIFFFDEDKEFVSVTEELAGNFDTDSVPETAEFFKIVIEPTNDAEVSWNEIGRYAGMLTVSINK
ncbi:MAG: hypothetical protein IJW43_00025 [Clostridia bacterium]|nr:hypothetical protein [Clostridia bacterium]